MALTDLAIRTAKPDEKPRKLVDEKGMYIRGGPAQLDRNLVFLSEFSAG